MTVPLDQLSTRSHTASAGSITDKGKEMMTVIAGFRDNNVFQKNHPTVLF